MGKGSRKNSDNQSFLIESIVDAFSRRIDNLNLSSLSTPSTSNRREGGTENHNVLFSEKLRLKELELKNVEIKLLKYENELIKTKMTNVPNNQSRSSQNYGFTFKDMEESISKFSGEDSLRVDKWIEEFEETAHTIGWDELQKLVYAKRCLVGTAKQSLRAGVGLNTWDDLKIFLKEEFKISLNTVQVHRMLGDRKKKINESFHSYLLSMQEIAHLGRIEDEALFDYVISGITDSEINKSVLYGAETMKEFKKNLKIYEQMKEKTAKKTETIPNNNYNKGEIRIRKGPRCYACGDSGHLGRDCKNKGKGMKCYKCNNFGHISPNCPGKTNEKLCSIRETAGGNIKKIFINGVELFAMVDSGSDVNLITRKKYSIIGNPNLNNEIKRLHCAGSQELTTDGSFIAVVSIDNDTYTSRFHVVADEMLPVSVIVGKDLMNQAITILTPNEVIIKKVLPEQFILTVHQDDELPIDVSHIHSKSTVDHIRQLIVNYTPISKHTPVPRIKLKILLSDEKPVYERPRRLSPLETNIARQQIEEWLKERIIRNNNSDFASSIVWANKKDGTKRLCVDYRRLNEKIIKDRYPLPLIEDQIDQLQAANLFSTLDLKEGFFHVPVDDESIKYTAFITSFGHYEFLRTPFGLCNSPSVFQRYINEIFHPLIVEKRMCVYMDDLIIPSKDELEGIQRLEEVLSIAETNNLKIKWSKCEFLKKKINYLGYEIEKGCIRPSTNKMKSIKHFPEPITSKCLQRFLGLTGYFRKFVEGYALLAKPLSDMFRKNQKFSFGPLQRVCFEKLKKVLTTKPVLKIYSLTAETELHCDASKEGIAAILLQQDDIHQKFHPVFYYSRKTSPAEEKYSSYELEALAIVKSLKKFRTYLLGLKFKIVTDCMAFNATIKKKDLSSRIAGWVLQLQEYNFTMEHRSSNRMRHVDALSRAPQVLIVEDGMILKIKSNQLKDESLKPIFEILKAGTYENYIVINDILYKVENGTKLLVVPKLMQTNVIQRSHEQGHLGTTKTEELVKREFYIKDLTKKVKSCIQNCVECILAERKRGKSDGFLSPIPKGDLPLCTYHIDHLGHLESTRKSYKYIFSIIDGYSKFVWLYPCKTLSTSEAIQKLEYQKAVFGNPVQIIADKSPTFTSEEFKEYCESENIKLHVITTGMPRGNGQVERLNQIVIPALTKLVGNKPEDWFKYTNNLQRYLNNSFQRSIGMSPFETMFGTKIRCPEEIRISEAIDQAAVAAFNDERNEIRERAKLNILKIQQENTLQFNKKRRKAIRYNLNDVVVIKRTQFSGGGKIQRKFLGPYIVTNVRDHDRYDVKKMGEGEGPRSTSTAAEKMKPYYVYDTDEVTEASEEED